MRAMDTVTLILLIAAAAIALWLIANVVSWYVADPGPVFGPVTDDRVTFRMQLERSARDVVEMTGLDKAWDCVVRFYLYWAPRVLNLVVAALVSLDAFIFTSPPLMTAIQESHYGWLFLFALHFAAANAIRNAPEKIPSRAEVRGMAV